MQRSGPNVIRSFATTSTQARPAPRSTSTPPAVATNRPTPQFQQHHAVTPPRVDGAAFRPAWLVQSRLWSLFEAGRIDRDGVDAALAWRRLSELVSSTRVQSWDVHVDVSTAPGDGGMGLRVDAAAQLRTVTEALGQLRVKILEALIVQDRSWSELGRLLQVSDKTAVQRAVEAIAALADWRAGRTVAAPPAIRFRNQPGSL